MSGVVSIFICLGHRARRIFLLLPDLILNKRLKTVNGEEQRGRGLRDEMKVVNE